ncbi:MAG: hypothetical protein RLZZ28_2487 [Bacteroidota bacterium]|jgi:signal transduction histidine kinase
MQKENSDFILAILFGSSFILLFGTITFLVIVNYVKHKRRFLVEKQMREAQYQQALLQAQLEMQDHTFQVVSQEIHDNVGQILSLVKLNLNILALKEKENESIDNLKGLVKTAIAELRDIGVGYYADRLVEKGLVQAIEQQVIQLNKSGIFTTNFHTQVPWIEMGKNKIIFLYRMVQEALNNVVKHSDADKVSVEIFEKNSEYHILISDNGKGFSQKNSSFVPGIGLKSIQQRAAMIDARALIKSEQGIGTTVNLIF